MSAYTNAERFLQAVFGSDYGTRAIFANAKYDPITKKLGTWRHFRSVKQLDSTRDCFLSPAAFPDDGITERTGARAVEVRALVIDDVGSEQVPAADVLKALGPPTFEVLTSAGSAHWWYRLAKPVPAAEWPDFFEEIERRVGHALDGAEAHHVFRLPMGVNTKPKRQGFTPCFGQVNLDVTLDAAAIMLFAPPRPARASSGGGGGWLRDIEEVARLIPNPDSLLRKAWVDNAYRFRALAADADAAWRAFELWSKKNEYWYDGDDTEKLWRQDLKPEATSGRELLVDAMIADPEGYQALMSREAQTAFDAGVAHPEVPKGKGITAIPFKWKDPASLALRDWLYGNILIRKFITMTVAPGGLGKSSLIASETLAQITGCDLLWERASRPLRVWLWNLEDPYEETERKILAAALHHKVKETDIGDRLFIASGRDQKLVIATTDRNKTILVQPVVDALISEIKRREIDVIVIDPFVSCHELPENDNTAQDMVVKEWGRVAELGNCAVHLIDHTRKAPSGTEVWTESARGAKSKTDAARVVRVLNRMTDDEGVRHGVSNPRQHFYALLDKANMSLPPPIDHRAWFHMESVNLGNGRMAEGIGAVRLAGDSIGVTERWLPPSAETLRTTANFEKVAKAMGNKLWRPDSRAAEWVGKAIGPALEFNEKTKAGRDRTAALLKGWLKDGLLQTVVALDKHRMEKEFIQIKEKHERF